MTKVTLTKKWARYEAGTVLEVDDLRARTLDEDGYLDPLLKEPPLAPTAPAPPKGEAK